jgi:hypothetical protein
LKKTKDGKALVPKLAQLKDYMEASLSVLELEVGGKSMNKLSKAPLLRRKFRRRRKHQKEPVKSRPCKKRSRDYERN